MRTLYDCCGNAFFSVICVKVLQALRRSGELRGVVEGGCMAGRLPSVSRISYDRPLAG